MAATVEGVFRIVDRASPKMRDMEKQAIKTDAAIASLGVTLDGLGSNKRLKNLDNVNRRMSTMSGESKVLTNETSRLDNAVRRQTDSVRKADSMWGRFSGTAKMFGKDVMRLLAPAKFLAMGTAIGVAGQAIGALSGGVLGLSSALGPLAGGLAPAVAGITGIGLAAITGKLAMNNLTQAMAGNAQALRSLTPAGHRFVVTLRQFRPILREFRSSAQGGLFTGLRSALQDVRGAAPTVNRVLAGMSRQLGGLAAQAGRRFTTRGFLQDFTNIAGQGTDLVGNGGRAAMNIVDSLRHVAVAAAPLTKWIGNMVEGWSRYIDRSARAGRESGRLANFFDRTRKTMTVMGHILTNLWHGFGSLMKVARPLGDLLYRDAERGTRAWATMLGGQQEQVKLTAKLISMEPGIRALFGLVGNLGRVLFNMGANTRLADTANNLSKALPAIATTLSSLANTFGPAFGNAIGQLANLLQTITGQGGGPLVSAVKAIGGIAGFLDRIARASPVVKSLFSVVFSTIIISRYAVKLGLLEKGWWRVAFAAKAAGEAEAIAGNAPVGGGVLGAHGRGIGGIFGRVFGRGRGGAAGEQLAIEGMGAARGAGMLGRLGGLAGVGGAVASKFFLPIMAMQGAFGALTAGRSGGIVNQIGQTGFGGVNAMTGGILGHFYHGLDTPDQRVSSQIAGSTSLVNSQMAAAQRTKSGMALLTAQLSILKRASDDIHDRTTQAGRDYIAQLQAQTDAIRQNIAAEKARRTRAGAAKGQAYLESLDQAAPGVIKNMGAVRGTHFLDQMAQAKEAGVLGNSRGAQAQRGRIIRGTLANAWRMAQANPALMPEYQSLAATYKVDMASHGHNFQIAHGQVFTGSRAERRSLADRLTSPAQSILALRSKGFTTMQQSLVASLVAAGQNPRDAAEIVRSYERGQTPGTTGYGNMKGTLILQGGQPFAGGGRLGGRGLSDSIPVPGGMAAPGELVVNRHTEQRVNSMLGTTTLGSLVNGENKRHSDRFATGGRMWNGHPALGGGIGKLARGVVTAFPGLSITATTDGHHANGSYHYKGEAVDIGGSTSAMFRAASWIRQRYGGSLLEGIHNPNLSIKNGAAVRPGFWGASTWAGHANHIHLALAGALSGGLPGGGGGGRRGGGGVLRSPGASLLTDLQKQTSRLGGLGGLNLRSPVGVSTATAATHAAHAASHAAGSYSRAGLMNLASSVGFPAASLPMAAAIAMAESGGRSTARNVNTNGTIDRGLWQINSIWGGLSTFDPIANAHSALQISKGGTNWGPWSTYHNGSYRKFMSKGGRMPKFGGWHKLGMDGVFDTPTMIGVGEGGRERVTVTPAGKSGGGGGAAPKIEANFYITGGEPGVVQREVEAALKTFADHLVNHEAP